MDSFLFRMNPLKADSNQGDLLQTVIPVLDPHFTHYLPKPSPLSAKETQHTGLLLGVYSPESLIPEEWVRPERNTMNHTSSI